MKKAGILIFEDEKFLAEMYELRLKQENMKIFIALDGQAGLDLLEQEKIDLILLDLVMPGMDGLQVLEKIKNNQKTKDIPVVIFSNLGEDEKKQEALDKGAIDYLVKADVTPCEVVKRIDKYLHK